MSIVKSKKGFTLIELVIVLAIAALILAAVLVAVTGAQKSRRDTQRKNDASTIASYLEQSASNNGGDYPANAGALTMFSGKYITSNNMVDPSTRNNYAPTYSNAVGAQPSGVAGTMVVGISGRKYSVCVELESTDVFCAKN